MDKKTTVMGDIYYEVEQLNTLYVTYFASKCLPTDITLKNAVIEKGLIHTRNLIDFFESTRSEINSPDIPLTRAQKDDVICEDYGFPGRILFIKSDLKKKINKRVAHLSFKRATLPREWIFSEFVPEIMRASKDFFEHILSTQADLPDSLTKEHVERIVHELHRHGG